MSALMVTIVGATWSATAPMSIRRSIASRGAATLIASSDDRDGGSFIQSVTRLPRNTPSVLATSATMPMAHTASTQRERGCSGGRFDDPSGGGNDGGDVTLGGLSGAGHFDGGVIGVMLTVYPGRRPLGNRPDVSHQSLTRFRTRRPAPGDRRESVPISSRSLPFRRSVATIAGVGCQRRTQRERERWGCRKTSGR